MSDLIDDAQQLEAEHLVLSLAAARVPIAVGAPGECDNCGDEFPRLVGGLCGFCRDGRRPLRADYDPRPAVPTVPIISEEEEPVPSPAYAVKVISAPIESRGTLTRIEAYASEHDLPLGRATVELAIAGLDYRDAPAWTMPPESAAEPITVVSLQAVPFEWLTAEIERRLDLAADPALVDAAVARAEAAEGQLATLRDQLRGMLDAPAQAGGAMSPFTTSTVRDGDVVRLTVMLSTDPGPFREFRPFLDVELDEPHAIMLFGELGFALQSFTDERAGNVVAFPGGAN